MATVITNRATVNYSYGETAATAVSNVATTVLQGALTIEKSSLAGEYSAGGEVTFMVTLKNTGAALTDLEVTDDLGAYALPRGGEAVPLDFIAPAQIYSNGVYTGDAAVAHAAGGGAVFTLPSVPACGVTQLLYRARANSFAPLGAGAQITNTVTAAPAGGEAVSDSRTITVQSAATLSVVKSMTPNPVLYGGVLTYTFDVYNSGNMAAADVVLTDGFDPAPAEISVFVNGTAVEAGDYSYVNGTLTLPVGGNLGITVPAAQFGTDPATGEVTVTPGHVQITVRGTV